MRCHAFLPTYWDNYGATTIDVAIAEAAIAAAALGYKGVWTNDAVIRPVTETVGAQVIEPFVTLASLVHLVPRLTLGTAVLVLPQRHPILVAKQAAALDLLSGHRLILGVGIGHQAEEFALLGADFAHRAGVTDEAIEVMQALWREPVASYHGRFHQFDQVSMAPHPPAGGPPIWIGGNSPAGGEVRQRLAGVRPRPRRLCQRSGRLPGEGGPAPRADAGATTPGDRQHDLSPHPAAGRVGMRALNDPVDAPAFYRTPRRHRRAPQGVSAGGPGGRDSTLRVRGFGRPAAPDAPLR